jgi:hypothetical protein
MMRSKYMGRGILFLLTGVALNLIGWVVEQKDLDVYKWAMGIGTILFGLGFLLILYSLIRKVECQSIKEDRAAEHEKANSMK